MLLEPIITFQNFILLRLESTLMVMEAFEDYNDKIVYDIVGHSGEENGLPFTRINKTPNNEKERLDVLKTMHAHSQFCMSGELKKYMNIVYFSGKNCLY